MKTKLLRTLEALQRGGPYGVHSFPLMREAGTTRVAARIIDLKKLGYIIESKRETLGGIDGCRYYLKGKRNGNTTIQKPVIRYRFQDNIAIPIV